MALASFVGALFLISPVLAQGDVAAGDQAVAFAREGLKHYQAGAWAEALENFQKADAASHSPVFVLYVARSQRSLGKLLDARATYRKLVSEPLGDDAIPSFRQAQADGRAELAALEPTIPSVVVRTVGASALSKVTIDGRASEPGKPVDLDPGDHQFVIIDGARRAEVQATLRPGDSAREVVLDLTNPVPDRPPPPSDAVQTEGSLVPGVVLLALGGASLLAGAVVGGLALKANDDIEARCPDLRCPEGVSEQEIEDDQASMLTMADASTGLLIAGGVVATVGVVLVIVRPGGDDGTVPAVRVGLGRVGLGWRF